MKVYVGNLDFEAKEDDIYILFNGFESKETVEIATGRENWHFRGVAFFLLSDDLEGAKAIAHLDGARLDGRSLTVLEMPPTGPTGFDALAC